MYTEFSKANITDGDVKRGKALFKNDLLRSTEYSNVVDYIAKQVSLDSVTTPDQVAAAIDSVTTADVQQVMKTHSFLLIDYRRLFSIISF